MVCCVFAVEGAGLPRLILIISAANWPTRRRIKRDWPGQSYRTRFPHENSKIVGQLGECINLQVCPNAIQLSSDELASLERGKPLHLQDTAAHELVLVLAEQYARLKQFIDIPDADPKSVYQDWEHLSAYP